MKNKLLLTLFTLAFSLGLMAQSPRLPAAMRRLRKPWPSRPPMPAPSSRRSSTW